MKKTLIFPTLLCMLVLLSACNHQKNFLIGAWKASSSELVPQGAISPEDQMIMNMLNGMIHNMMKDMTLTFHSDGDYVIQFYQKKGLGTYELRANNSVLSLATDETFGKIYAEVQNKEKREKELILEFRDELLSDPTWEVMVSELGMPVVFKITFQKKKGEDS